ncbi:hypothetical protein HDU98_004008 [Podochytrium sp. JEL0797]|nr:hypothetical protein HDU98_004008 [Podochytrium sp. JEL0797]
MLPAPKTILLDLGGVILNIDYSLTSKAFAERLGIADFATKLFAQGAQRSEMDAFERGEASINTADLFCQYLRTCDAFTADERFRLVSAADHELIACWNAMLLDIPPQRIAYLQDLRRRGHRLFLLSNINCVHEACVDAIIERDVPGGLSIFRACFDRVFYSHLIGRRKPDVDTFEFVVAEMGCEKGEVVFFDDSIQHVEGARRAGVQAVLVPREHGTRCLTRFLGTTHASETAFDGFAAFFNVVCAWILETAIDDGVGGFQAPSVTASASEVREMIQLSVIEDTISLCEGTKLGAHPSSTTAASHASGLHLASSANNKSQASLLLGASRAADLNNDLMNGQNEGGEAKFLPSETWRFRDSRNYDFKLNVSVVGAKGAGKRTMVIKECGNRHMNWDLNVEFKDKTYVIKEKLVRVEYWIANTPDGMLAHTAKLLSSSAATIFVFDVNSRRSLNEITKWLQEMNKNPHHQYAYKPIKVLLGNTMDTRKMRAISKEEASAFAKKHNMLYHECSSNDRKTFKHVYYSIARLVMDPILALAQRQAETPSPLQQPFPADRDMNLSAFAMANGFVRTRVAARHFEKVGYSQMVEEMERNGQVTETMDWF